MNDNSFYGPLEDPAGNAGYEEHPPRVGFFTDTSVCIGCKACEVACKEWNGVPDDGFNLLGMSFDNTGMLGADSWRHVAFIEQPEREPVELGMPGFSRPGAGSGAETRTDFRWLMSSDVCKHCTHAGCLDVCPTGALFRTEFGTVVVQQDICNGCGYCVSACPYGVIERREGDGRAWKCTLCYDRLRDGLEPACAKACPTDSIQFGPLDELRERAAQRVSELHGGHDLAAYARRAGARLPRRLTRRGTRRRCGSTPGWRRRRWSWRRCRRSWGGDDARRPGGAAGGVPLVLRACGAEVAGMGLEDRGVSVHGWAVGGFGDAGGRGGCDG